MAYATLRYRLQIAYLFSFQTRPELKFRSNSQSKLKFTKEFKNFYGYLVIKRQLLLLDWEFIPSRAMGFTLS